MTGMTGWLVCVAIVVMTGLVLIGDRLQACRDRSRRKRGQR